MAGSKKIDFEASLGKLSTIVDAMEKGDLSLEQSLTQFEQGVALARQCQTALEQAEQKVVQLTEKNGELVSKPLQDD